MVGRLSPGASQQRDPSRVKGFTLADGVAITDRRGNRRRSADGCRARAESVTVPNAGRSLGTALVVGVFLKGPVPSTKYPVLSTGERSEPI